MTAGYLDTNILVGFFKGEDSIRSSLERFDSLKIPAVAYAEFLVGLPYREQRDAANQAIDHIASTERGIEVALSLLVLDQA